MFKQIARNYRIGNSLWASANKGDLAKLRKKTGYTFANCRKALEENNNDVTLAEKWLKDQAQAMGWIKASKVQGRAASQGLIGVSMKGDTAVIVEVNCETDFVARNKGFKSLVDLATSTFLKDVTQQHVDSLSKTFKASEDLKNLTSPEGKSLADHTALTISSVGENIILRRAGCFKAPQNVFLSGYTHPKPENLNSKVTTGKYGALIAYTTEKNDSQVQLIAQQLCQHIIGMDPVKVGTIGEDVPSEDKEDENIMIHQEFLVDPSITVEELITDARINILDFIRFECGQEETETETPVKVSQAV